VNASFGAFGWTSPVPTGTPPATPVIHHHAGGPPTTPSHAGGPPNHAGDSYRSHAATISAQMPTDSEFPTVPRENMVPNKPPCNGIHRRLSRTTPPTPCTPQSARRHSVPSRFSSRCTPTGITCAVILPERFKLALRSTAHSAPRRLIHFEIRGLGAVPTSRGSRDTSLAGIGQSPIAGVQRARDRALWRGRATLPGAHSGAHSPQNLSETLSHARSK